LFPADFLLNTNTVNIILFYSTNSNLKLLCSSDKIFVDDLFYSCPKYFYQLFTVHIFKNRHYVPLSYFLLPHKSTNTYATAFRCIIKSCSAQNLYFNPTTIIADYYIYYYYLFYKMYMVFFSYLGSCHCRARYGIYLYYIVY
jgi:hypothetical protein